MDRWINKVRIVEPIEAPPPLSERTRKRDRIPGARPRRPHPVRDLHCNLTAAAQYDSSNNLIAAKARSGGYTSFNMPQFIDGPSLSTSFAYGPEHQRVRQMSGSLGTTYYLNPGSDGELGYEKDIRTDGSVEERSFITAHGQVVAVMKRITQSGTITNPVRYFHRDNLGSTTTVTNEAGAVVERLAYEAFGKRRFASGVQDPTGSIVPLNTDRGFTNHEHIDELGVIHMNGRIYDPVIGRFMSPDPYINDPSNLQSYNRYAYVLNNPLGYTDPSGYWSLGSIFRAAVIIVAAYYTGGAVMDAYAASAATSAAAATGAVASSAAYTAAYSAAYSTAIASTTAAAIGGAAAGFTGGFLASGGDLKAGVQGAITGGILGGVSGAVNDWSSSVAKIGVRAATSAFLARMQGGNFGEAFRYAFLSGAAGEGFRDVVGWKADPFPGKNQSGVGLPCGAPDSTCYTLDAERGDRIPESWKNINVSGENVQMNGDGDYLKQGGWVGQIVNALPKGKALSQFHDNLFNTGMLKFSSVTNWGSMLPAAAISYGALVDQLPVDRSRCPKCYR